MEFLELDARVFDLVYESFWDLYTFKSTLPELNAKKLQAWIAKVKLVVNE